MKHHYETIHFDCKYINPNYIENNDKSSVYKRFSDGKWMQLKDSNWSIVKQIDELEKLFKQKKDASSIN